MRITAAQIAKGKLMQTISAVESVLGEAHGDSEIGTSYSAKAVYSRVKLIKKALDSDVEQLTTDIEPELRLYRSMEKIKSYLQEALHELSCDRINGACKAIDKAIEEADKSAK